MFWKGLILIGLALLTMLACNGALSLMSNPSDLEVGLGLVILAALVIGWYLLFKKTPLFRRHVLTLALLSICGLMTSACSGCTRVNVGHVGIEVHYAGSDRGVENYPRLNGWVFYNPISSEVLEYPTFVQTAVWTMSRDEGANKNEELCFNSKEGLIICGDISLSYQLDAAKVPAFYVKFRSDDLSLFTHGFLRNVARDAFNEIAAQYPVEDLYGGKKEEFLMRAKQRINSQVASIGVEIQQFGFIGPPRLPAAVVGALNSKIAATQNAIRVENELRMAEAEAKKAVAKAEGESRANEALTKSLSPQLLTWRQLDIMDRKWNGAFPLYYTNGGGSSPIPLMQMPAAH